MVRPNGNEPLASANAEQSLSAIEHTDHAPGHQGATTTQQMRILENPPLLAAKLPPREDSLDLGNQLVVTQRPGRAGARCEGAVSGTDHFHSLFNGHSADCLDPATVAVNVEQGDRPRNAGWSIHARSEEVGNRMSLAPLISLNATDSQ